MPSFNPGTKVFAQLPNKTIWRVAKVAEPDPKHTPDPAVIYVIFPGKSEKVKRNLKQVKLPPQRVEPSPAPEVDLTDDIKSQQNASSSLPLYSDPWDPNSPKPPTLIPSNSHNLQSELPSSPPAKSAPSPPVQNLPSSSRDWHISNSHPHHHHVNQTHAQLVRDPSLPTYSKHEFPPWLGSNRPPSVETAPYPHAPRNDQNFGSESLRTSPHNFHSPPLRQNSAAPHIRSHPLPNIPPPQPPPSYAPLRYQFSNGAGQSNTRPPHLDAPLNATRPLTNISSSQVSQRNGLTLRGQDRHPFRSVDKSLSIPRTPASRIDFGGVPRHPQSTFDDDVPIPRNIARTRLSSSSHDAFSDHPRSSYPASKRQRLDYKYDMIVNDQMPPPFNTEAAASKLSKRLAKRKIDMYKNHWDDGQNETSLQLLPYQHRLTNEGNGVIIAPSFSLLESRHQKLPKTTSDDETNILEEVFTGLSLSSAESFPESGVQRPESAIRIPPLAVRGGTRKKNRPKKLCALSYGERKHDLGDCSTAAVNSNELESLNDEQVSKLPIPKVFGCPCPENDKQLVQHEDTIQCSRCSLWFHRECAGFEAGDLRRIQDDLREHRTDFICVQCLDNQVSLPSAQRTPQQQISREGSTWFSLIPRITKRIPGNGITATDPWLHYTPPRERGRDKRHWLREPLAEDEKSARLDNLERLREGVANASVGAREREVFDVISVKGMNAGGL